MMSSRSKTDLTEDLGDLVADVLTAPLRIGVGMANALSTLRLPSGESCCEIPEPCWMPQPLGEVEGFACPGGTAVLRVRITNCGLDLRKIKVHVTGPDAAHVSIDPVSLALGPKERGRTQLSFTVPANATDDEEFEAIIWIDGCKLHYLRWIVVAGERSGDCCHEVEFEDCPDLIHHWYDHFYCYRPCPSDSKRRVPGG
jgi:hypothetical protein